MLTNILYITDPNHLHFPLLFGVLACWCSGFFDVLVEGPSHTAIMSRPMTTRQHVKRRLWSNQVNPVIGRMSPQAWLHSLKRESPLREQVSLP